MKRKKELMIVVVLLAAIVTVATAASIFGTTDGTVVWDAPNGPEIQTNNTDVTESVPIRDTVVDLGMIDVTGPAGSSATLSSVAGSETTLSSVDTAGGTMWADHQDAQRIGVEGVDSVTWDQVDLTVDETEISVSGSGTLYVDGFDPDQYVRVDISGEPTIQQANQDGVLVLTVSNEDLTFLEPSMPSLFDPYPTDQEAIADSPVTLQIGLAHDDITAETIDLEWELNGNVINTSTVTEEGVYSVDTTAFQGGLNTWNVTATDTTGGTETVGGSFRTPTTIEIRDELSPKTLVDDTQAAINVTFYGDEGTVQTRTTSDGTVDMSGLPLDQSFTVQIEADGYKTRQSYVRSIVERQTIYLLNESTDTVQTQFQLEDPTGQFDLEESIVFVKKPITRNGETTYKTVVADFVGPGGWTTSLAADERYVIEVENSKTGQTRKLGPYVSTVSEAVTLEVDELQFDFSGRAKDIGYRWSASYVNETGPAVNFQFDADQRIDRFHVKIYQQHNQSNVILNETERNYNGLLDYRGIISASVDNPDTTNWVVEWEATIDGETVGGSKLVGKGQLNPNFPGLGNTVLSIVGVLTIFVVAGFFSQANVRVGAIATSLVAGALWVVGVLPDAVSGIFIAIALLVGVIYYIHRGPQPR